MKIEVAAHAGFCFGVDRAVKQVYKLLEEGKKAATLGPIIHNPRMVRELEEKGVRAVERPEDTPEGTVLVIRSHGVSQKVTEEIESLGIPCCDATCPFVKKIHEIARRAGEEGRVFLLAGDREHPEVQGIIGHCVGEHYVVNGARELEEVFSQKPSLREMPVTIASQTTFHKKEWENTSKTLKKLCTNAAVFDTICNATALRQTEAASLAGQCDAMLVLGGRNSSNTDKLLKICAQYGPAFLIEGADELPALFGEDPGKAGGCLESREEKTAPLLSLGPGGKIGITAGASTPASIIKEVLAAMSEINNTEQNFEEMLEESLKSLNTDEKVHGVVVGISPTEVYVDVGRKQAGFIPANELSNDPAVKPEDVVKLGDEMELLIMKTNDQEGTIMLSKRRVDAMKGWDEIAQAQESGEILSGKVIEVVKGGVIVLKDAMRIFVPASQATASRGEDLNELMGKEVKFRIIEVNRQRRRAVGSIRSVLREERRAAQEKFWSEIEEGQRFTGKVKSLTNFGAFVDLGGVDGMVHISELSWNRIKHPSEVLNVGDTAEVYIKSLDRENNKISLGYKRPEDNPWEKMKNEYPAGTVCDVKIVGLTQFGAFATVIPGIDGLIHISQIADHRIEKPQDVLKVGDEVKVKITEVDLEKHRVSLSIRALLEEQQAAEDEAAKEAPENAIVYVAGEDAPAAEEKPAEPAETVEPEKAEEPAAEEPAEE